VEKVTVLSAHDVVVVPIPDTENICSNTIAGTRAYKVLDGGGVVRICERVNKLDNHI
jgi:hypothetical protein